jgi:hypothetical protein
MAGPSDVQLNSGSGGATVATYLDSSSNQHARVVVEYENTGSDPVIVGSATPLPVTAASLPLPAGAALDTSVNGILLTPGVTIGTNKGPLMQGEALTASPTYTTGTVNPVVLDTSGNLCVNIKAGAAAGGTSITDNGTFTRGTSSETPVAGIVAVAGSPVALTAGKSSVVTVDSVDNGLWSHLVNGIASGTAGTPSSNVVTIQGVTSMTPVQVQVLSEPSGGATRSSVVAPATPAVQTLKSGSGTLFMLSLTNTSSSIAYIHFYDVSGTITLGTTSATDVYAIPANTSGAGSNVPVPTVGLAFTNQIAYAVTGGIGATDNSAITGSAVIVNAAYK